MQQGALAASRWADQTNNLAFEYLHVDRRSATVRLCFESKIFSTDRAVSLPVGSFMVGTPCSCEVSAPLDEPHRSVDQDPDDADGGHAYEDLCAVVVVLGLQDQIAEPGARPHEFGTHGAPTRCRMRSGCR